MGVFFPLAAPLLRALDAERAHRLAIGALSLMPAERSPPDDARLVVEVLGKRFPNPVGLAAGFDKDCEAPDALLSLGFGFVELGGVVPKPQAGNPRPRVFRLLRDEAIINRYGLNSRGLAPARERLLRRKGRPGIVGVNIAPNKDSADRVRDYILCIEALAGLVDFVTINVSSPNTPGLRDLQSEAFLGDLLARCVEARDEAQTSHGTRTAIVLKIAPDISPDTLDAIVATALNRGIDALTVSNTTVTRPSTLTETDLAREAGGLSGKPLFALSTKLLAQTYLRVGRSMPLIGVGGIDSAAAAFMKIRAGASLLQLYSALVFKGPCLIGEIKQGLVGEIAAAGLSSLGEATGRDAAAIAEGRF